MSGFEYDKYKFSMKKPSNLELDDVIENRKEEIERLNDDLLEYKILIKDLAYDEVSYMTRNKILNIAYFIIEEVELFDYINTTKKFPINRLLKRTPIDKEFYIQWKEYIIAYVVILSNPNYKYLQEYIQIEESINILGAEEMMQNNKEEEYRGIILSKGLSSAIILTSKGEFIKVKAGKNNKIGEDFIGKEGFKLRKYKLQISIFLSILVVIFSIGLLQYKLIDKTVVIETTSSITLEVNKFSKIIDAYTQTEKGNIMLDKLNVVNSDIDTSMREILNYAIDNEMIPDTGVLITITGKALKDKELNLTEKFIEEKELKVKLNNSGDEHKINP
ncbi:anti-sigma factor domain-containing protein [Clostridium sp. Sa3CUN1]|uniref:Anti-sigma factor domain-containing protein n=1 Tax=Clostridium gallinarum TaxID=2762246 RepID=A0ABR8Q0N3_9CLOT|nr:anti-sigma factor domain-containing protein [Clostridium gallinarum]MBD7913978.1 anti-sigma factor domain-containing protein [Clostridium gallinarum]